MQQKAAQKGPLRNLSLVQFIIGLIISWRWNQKVWKIIKEFSHLREDTILNEQFIPYQTANGDLRFLCRVLSNLLIDLRKETRGE